MKNQLRQTSGHGCEAFLQRANWGEQAHTECGQQHPMVWVPELNKGWGNNLNATTHPLCFLTAHTVWPAASDSCHSYACHHGFSMTDYILKQNKTNPGKNRPSPSYHVGSYPIVSMYSKHIDLSAPWKCLALLCLRSSVAFSSHSPRQTLSLSLFT